MPVSCGLLRDTSLNSCKHAKAIAAHRSRQRHMRAQRCMQGLDALLAVLLECRCLLRLQQEL
jgi:hypothetical protein